MDTRSVFTTQNMLAWKAYLRSQDYEESTISRRLHGARSAWKILHRNGLIPCPPPEVEAIDIPRKRRAVTRSLNEEEFLRFALTPIAAPDSSYGPLHLRDAALFALKAAVPISTRRMCQLDREHVDLDAGALQVDADVIPLPGDAIERLGAYLQVTSQGTGPLFLTCHDARIDHNTYRKAFHRHCETCGIPPVGRADLSRLTPPQRQRFLRTPVSSYVPLDDLLERNRLVIRLLCWLGLRPSEVAKLEARDVLAADRQLVLRETKSGDTQSLPLPEELVPHLHAWTEGLDPGRRIFRVSQSTRMDRKHIYRVVREHGEHCGLKGVNPRLLRRSLSRILYDNGASLEIIGLLLRHYEKRKSTTEIYYTLIQTQHIEPVFDFHPLRLHARRSQ